MMIVGTVDHLEEIYLHITCSSDEMRKVLEMNFVQEAFTREMIEEMVKEVGTALHRRNVSESIQHA